MTTPVSALSFHCMICFEEFHHAERYPVVLPCGHTYVCHICAEKLDKCMECRTLLTWSIPNAPRPGSPNMSNTRASGWSSGRAAARATSKTPPPMAMEKKRLPLPKNVVLLSLMEATELASEISHTRTRIDSLIDEHDATYDDEEEKIKMSTSLTIGACGTYVVADKDGLEVYPSRPNGVSLQESGSHEETDMPTEEDVNSLVRFFHLDHKIEVSNAEGHLKSVSSEDSALIALHYGDRVQIVSFDDDGWAKLARGYGYVRANPRQLVKVGGSVDKACRLEAYLHALAAQQRELKAESSKIETRFIGLMNSLQASLFDDEDLTVIAGDTCEEDSEATHIVVPQGDDQEHIGRTFSDDSGLMKAHDLVRQATPPSDGICSMGSVLQAMSATLGGDVDFDGAMPQAARATIDQNGHPNRSTEPAQPQKPTHTQARMSPPRSRELSAEAEAWRERYYRHARNNTSVDFRTGMSGHQGLVSYMVHPHSYLEAPQTPPQQQRPKMSSHLGLSRTHGPSQGSSQSPPSYPYSSSASRDQL